MSSAACCCVKPIRLRYFQRRLETIDARARHKRHTYATLLLQAGVPLQVVQQRLRHKKIEITLSVYAHALPSMQQDAAERLAAILH